MIFNRKKHPKLFWVEGLVYLAIIVVCMLGSFGVFDAKAQELAAVDTCETWVELPSTLRIQILQYGIISELKANPKEGTDSLIECLSEQNRMKRLDEDILTECREGGEENLAEAFDKGLERIIFRCLKWVNGEENETSAD